jgi:Uncharacterized conserved protein
VLPFDLVRYRILGERVIPKFLTDDNVDLVEEILSSFSAGRKLGEALEEVSHLEKVYDYKLVRGLARLITRTCELESQSTIDPRRVRRELFLRGPQLTEEGREKVLAEVREMLNVDPQRVMFSDLDEEKVIVRAPQLTPSQLMKWYNLALVQSLLLRSVRMIVWVQDGWKTLLWRAKRVGLMYNAYEDPLRIEFEGPMSLLKFTDRYGRAMAIVLPYVTSSSKWKVEANVALGKVNKKVYRLELANYPNLLNYEVEEDKFDSSVEEKFFKEFSSAVRDWKIIREPEPLVSNGKLYIPDFLLTKGGLKVYMEIAGFWTRDYIRRKLEKLRSLRERFLLLLDRELSYEEISDMNVILFRKKVDVGSVYKWLKSVELAQPTEVGELQLNLTGDVEPLDQVAARLGVGVDLLRKVNKDVPGYVKVADLYVKERVLNDLKSVNFSGKRLSEVSSEYRELSPFMPQLLEKLGYRLKWIDVTDAVIVKSE